MARSTESVALKLMKALQKESEREPNLSKCKTMVSIGTPICKSQEEFDRVAKFLTSNRMIDATRRSDGLAAKPNSVGQSWMNSQKEKWDPSARTGMLTLIFAVLMAAVAAILALLKR